MLPHGIRWVPLDLSFLLPSFSLFHRHPPLHLVSSTFPSSSSHITNAQSWTSSSENNKSPLDARSSLFEPLCSYPYLWPRTVWDLPPPSFHQRFVRQLGWPVAVFGGTAVCMDFRPFGQLMLGSMGELRGDGHDPSFVKPGSAKRVSASWHMCMLGWKIRLRCVSSVSFHALHLLSMFRPTAFLSTLLHLPQCPQKPSNRNPFSFSVSLHLPVPFSFSLFNFARILPCVRRLHLRHISRDASAPFEPCTACTMRCAASSVSITRIRYKCLGTVNLFWSPECNIHRSLCKNPPAKSGIDHRCT